MTSGCDRGEKRVTMSVGPMQPRDRDTGRLRFGGVEFDVRTGELWKDGTRTVLPDQLFRVLAMLVRERGSLVTRDELGRVLWPDHTFVDFEHGLNAAIKRLREALGDSASAPRFIETIPRRGSASLARSSRARLPQPPRLVRCSTATCHADWIRTDGPRSAKPGESHTLDGGAPDVGGRGRGDCLDASHTASPRIGFAASGQSRGSLDSDIIVRPQHRSGALT